MKKKLLFFLCFLAVAGFNYTTTFAQITLPYQQKFNLQNFPPFWTQTSTISPRWSISQTSNAGGTPNEMMASGTAGIGVSRLIVGPINTTGLTSLNLQFNQRMSCTDTANISLRVQSSVDGVNWTNEGFTLDENSFNCANAINITINNNVGSTTYIAWFIAGNHTLIDHWYIDDIIISPVFTNDVGISTLMIPDVIAVPNQSLDAFGVWPVISVAKNFGTIPQSFLAQMNIIDSSSTSTFTTMVTNLAPGAQVIVDFDGFWLPPPGGEYTMSFCTQLQGDQNPINDCNSRQLTVVYDDVPRFQLSVNINNGWNIVSIPGVYDVMIKTVEVWWPGRDMAASVYKFEGSYKMVTNVQPGIGYWMKNSGDQTYNTGEEWPQQGILTYPHFPIVLSEGWNLISGYESSFPTENLFSIPPDIISAPVYGYDGGYGEADTLMPGFGYWVKASASGLLMIDTSCTNTPPQSLNKSNRQTELFKEEWGKIIITDAAGQNYTLYSVTTLEDLNRYELPPPPPAEVFDIRYSSGKIAEDLSSSQSIEMNGVVYPVKIKVENMQVKITDAYNSEIDRELKPGEELIIHNNQINKLTVQSSSPNVPVTYSLDQNYPNPFNPVTTIKYSIAQNNLVTIKVYDVLGKEVATLVNEEKPAGVYEIEFSASEIASGIYFYRLQAGSFVETKKMILLR